MCCRHARRHLSRLSLSLSPGRQLACLVELVGILLAVPARIAIVLVSSIFITGSRCRDRALAVAIHGL